MKTIALLGQPNSGKSSLFNGLTGSHQHVGNWPGKTVEHKEGTFTYQGAQYRVIDLPGSYSLAAGSEEEMITTEYMESGEADLVAILVDSSQLERSLYMFTDFVGMNVPVLLILNLMDVAKAKGIQVDVDKLQEKLGIPVMGFVAADMKQYGRLKEQIANAITVPQCVDVSLLTKYYEADESISFNSIVEQQESGGIYSKEKAAIRDLEKSERGLKQSGKHKYELIDQILKESVHKERVGNGLNRFDKWALGKRSGKWIALGVIVLAMVAAMVVAMPVINFL